MRSGELLCALVALASAALASPTPKPACQCVEFWLCSKEGKEITDGAGLVSPRIGSCPELQVCCIIAEATPTDATSGATDVTPGNNETTTAKSGGGYTRGAQPGYSKMQHLFQRMAMMVPLMMISYAAR
uniref:PPAF-2-like Clip domain-containing protein n=1 Tax=Riptortus pedestris TaxID=329032 RepID=R4WSN1_RIPPE|nr:unknown secreted protein [Riptortus pedestris]